MGFDDVITYLSDFGTYQKRLYFLLCLPAITCAFHRLAGVFLLARPDFRCVLPTEHATLATYDSLPPAVWNTSYPYDGLTHKWQTCVYLNGTESVQCDTKFVYDKSKYPNSAVTEWHMVCDRSLWTAFSDSMFMVGVLLGSILFGQLADKYGRKPILTVSLILQVVFGISAGIAPEYFTYTLSRMIIGATTSGVFVAYVISMEMVGASYRLLTGLVCQVFFSLGFMLTAVFAYFIHDWRWLQLALTLPGVIFFCYHWIIPESPRWLLSTGRKSEAIAIIRKAAKVNKVTIPEEVYENLMDDAKKSEQQSQVEDARSYTLLDLFKYPNMRRKTLLIFFNWFVNSGTYYGLSWNTNNLGDNVLLNFMISGAVEIPAYIILALTLNRYGRRSILCGSMLAAGSALLLTVFVPNNMNWLLITLAMLGKLAITASYGTVYIFTAEQFPTVVRNIGLGSSSMVARFGSILAPYMSLVGEIWRPLPLLICGALALTAGLLSLPLPETLNKPLPDTLIDGENFGKTPKTTNSLGAGEELSKMMLRNGKIDEESNCK